MTPGWVCFAAGVVLAAAAMAAEYRRMTKVYPSWPAPDVPLSWPLPDRTVTTVVSRRAS